MSIAKFYWIIFLAFAYVSAQDKLPLKPEDYHHWNEIWLGQISQNGEWVSYGLTNPVKGNKLVVRHTSKNDSIAINFGQGGLFSENSGWFACKDNNDVSLLNLKTAEIIVYKNSSDFQFSGNYFILLSSGNPDGTLLLKELDSNQEKIINGVTEYSCSPHGKILGICRSSKANFQVEIITLGGDLSQKKISDNPKNLYCSLTWDKGGTTVAFFEKNGDDNVLHAYNLKKHLLSTLADGAKGIPKDFSIHKSKIVLGDKGKYICIKLHEETPSQQEKVEGSVEIWKTSDRIVPPVSISGNSISALWLTENNLVVPADKDSLTELIPLSTNKALLFGKKGYMPDFKYGGEDLEDIYILDVSTGKKSLQIQKFVNDRRQILISPYKKFVAYFQDKNWWVYDVRKNTHVNLTAKLPFPVENVQYDSSGVKPAYGSPGWTTNDEEILIYDQFDVWRISPSGNILGRITAGREKGIVYRIYENAFTEKIHEDFFNYEGHAFDLREEMIFEIREDINLKSGYAIRKANGQFEILTLDEGNVNRLYKAKLDNSFVWLKQNFDLAPRLVYSDGYHKQHVVVNSNPQQDNYYWGKAELIRYQDKYHNPLRAALFYPANYDPQLQYPMVVCIYEKKAKEMRNYIIPSLEMHSGFNVSNYTSEGYFVLYPDINYKINNPGLSALECVIPAVEKVKSMGVIDNSRIGIYGHSMGGFETVFIIGKTDIFKAAVAGAPVTNLISNYLDIDGLNQPNIWRYESQQLRLDLPYYNPSFLNNSPLMSAETMNTPLLLWAGIEDNMVNWRQSRELFMALWRLGKRSTLLLYPGEDHVMGTSQNKKDVYLRTKAWFDYYLKDYKKADFIPE